MTSAMPWVAGPLDPPLPAAPPLSGGIDLLIAPWRTRTRDDDARLRDQLAASLALGRAPLFLPLVLQDVISDEIPEQRALAVRISALLCATLAGVPGTRCLVLGPRETEGMASDLAAWRAAGGAEPTRAG